MLPSTLVPTLLLAALALAGCNAPDAGVDLGPRPDYDPGVTAADFVQGIDNPWLPFKVGSRWVYEATTEDGTERVEVTVLPETRTILGVQATVVRDTVTLGGELVEDTHDWYAQDRQGNVWYLGEDTCEYEDGECVDTHGAWEWGRDGALPGVVMWADPLAHVGTDYYQEFYWGEAIDQARVVGSGERVTVPAGTYADTVTTLEWNPVEGRADSEERVHYARGVGVLQKAGTDGPGEGERLIDFTR